jgi:transposase-like protein
MHIKLHAKARTTPAIRAEIQESTNTVAELAKRFGVCENTIRKWKSRSSTEDKSHTRHRLGQSTSPEEEALILGLRNDVALGLDDILEVMHRCVNPKLSRSAIYRCLKRYGVSACPSVPAEKETHQPFEETPFGFVHIDLKELTRLQGQKQYVFVAIERQTRFVYVEVIDTKKATTIRECLLRFLDSFPYVHTILTDNGSEFTDRGAVSKKNKPHDKPSGEHVFDVLCRERGIEHRLTRPYRPQTNGMVERFNRRLSEALRRYPITQKHRNRFSCKEDRVAYIKDFVYAYNRTRLKCIGYKAPLEHLHNHTKPYTLGRGLG